MAWIVVAVLMPVALLNYLDRQMLASMKYSVMRRHPQHWHRRRTGGTCSGSSNGSTPSSASSADTWRTASAGASRFAEFVCLVRRDVVTGHVTTYNELLIVRSLMGISEAFYIPAALALIADYHTGHTRSRAVGLHQMAIYCGVILGGFGGYVADDAGSGWRFAFTSCGIFGMLYALPLMLILRDAPSSKESTVVPKTISSGQASANCSPTVSFILLVLYFTLPALAGWVVRDWMPAILKQQFGIGQGHAAWRATLYWQVGGNCRRSRRRLAGRSLDASATTADASSSAPLAWA